MAQLVVGGAEPLLAGLDAHERADVLLAVDVPGGGVAVLLARQAPAGTGNRSDCSQKASGSRAKPQRDEERLGLADDGLAGATGEQRVQVGALDQRRASSGPSGCRSSAPAAAGAPAGRSGRPGCAGPSSAGPRTAGRSPAGSPRAARSSPGRSSRSRPPAGRRTTSSPSRARPGCAARPGSRRPGLSGAPDLLGGVPDPGPLAPGWATGGGSRRTRYGVAGRAQRRSVAWASGVDGAGRRRRRGRGDRVQAEGEAGSRRLRLLGLGVDPPGHDLGEGARIFGGGEQQPTQLAHGQGLQATLLREQRPGPLDHQRRPHQGGDALLRSRPAGRCAEGYASIDASQPASAATRDTGWYRAPTVSRKARASRSVGPRASRGRSGRCRGRCRRHRGQQHARAPGAASHHASTRAGPMGLALPAWLYLGAGRGNPRHHVAHTTRIQGLRGPGLPPLLAVVWRPAAARVTAIGVRSTTTAAVIWSVC